MKKVLAVTMSIMMALSLVACGGSNNTTTASAKDSNVIKFGVFEPLTGENGGGGQQEVWGIEYANAIYKTINVGGKEYTIELDVQDNKSTKDEGVKAANKLIGDKVVGIIGSYGSGVSIAAGGIFEEAKVPAIGCSCTNPQVTSGNEYYFRTCFLDPFQGTVMASYAKKHGYKRVAVITQMGDDYSEGLGNFFVKACEKEGIEVVAKEKFQTNAQDFKAQLSNIKSVNPDFIFAPSSITTAPLIIEQAKRDLGMTCQLGGGDTWENGTIIDNAHGYAEGCVVTTFYDEKSNPTAEGKVFISGNGKMTGFSDYLVSKNQPKDIPAVSALGYDAYLALYKAIERAQSLDGTAIKNALKTLSYEGVTGAISFNA
ncbi:MAG: ABC transporter substrate-binding protein, partial [Lachnospiraceae bacterium]|nr:ABC transporter substrate-binding protein [Lachnospiraceae bacterium]